MIHKYTDVNEAKCTAAFLITSVEIFFCWARCKHQTVHDVNGFMVKAARCQRSVLLLYFTLPGDMNFSLLCQLLCASVE